MIYTIFTEEDILYGIIFLVLKHLLAGKQKMKKKEGQSKWKTQFSN